MYKIIALLTVLASGQQYPLTSKEDYKSLKECRAAVLIRAEEVRVAIDAKYPGHPPVKMEMDCKKS